MELRDAAPALNKGPRTELHVSAWYADKIDDATDENAVALRLYNETDFRSEMLSGGQLEGAITDPRDHSDGPPTSAALETQVVDGTPVTLYSTTGSYEVDFSTIGRVRGSFTAHLSDNTGVAPPRDVDIRFDLAPYVDCYVRESDDGRLRRLDPDFVSEFCAPFRAWKRDGD